MAAAMREQLITTAAERWQAERSTLSVQNACVVQTQSGRKATFGELAKAIDWVKVIGVQDQATPADLWQYGGKSLRKVNGPEFVTGKHEYTSDLKRPAMLFGAVLRAPSFGAKLQSVDTSNASQLPGATVIRDGDFVGVTALNEFVAKKALASITAKWQEQQQISAKDLFPYLKANASDGNAEAPAAELSVAQQENGAEASKPMASTYTIGLYRTRSTGAARGPSRVDERRADGLDRNAAALRCTNGVGGCFSDARGQGASDCARHRLGLWRKTHGRMRN